MILKFLLFIIFSHFLVFLVSGVSLTFISVGLLFPVILLVVFILSKLPKKLAVLIILFIALHNIHQIINSNDSIFKVQPGMILKDEIALVNKTYEIANGRKFSLNTVTNPYLYPTLWAYLYKNHPPFYRGLTPYTYAGQNVFPMNDQKQELEFLIIEPEVGAANSWANQLIDAEKHRHDLKQEFKFGELTLLVF
ncbi:MAG: hypothetical protein Q7S14_00020 [bacterium]|nr:hypothetical protein [bacterium]